MNKIMYSNSLIGNIIINMQHVIIITGILCTQRLMNSILQHYNTQNYKAISQFYIAKQ